MKKKALLCSCLILLIIVIVSGIILFTNREEDDQTQSSQPVVNTEVQNTEVTNISDESNSETLGDIETESPIIDEQDRELKFDNYIVDTKDSETFYDDTNDVIEDNNYDVSTDIVSGNGFSNGFAMKDTENTTVATHGFNDGILNGKDGTMIVVSERDASICTKESVRENLLHDYGFGYYLACGPKDIPLDAPIVFGEGLTGWETYFETEPAHDPTISEYGQLLCDTKVSTAFGETLFIIYFSPSDEKFYAFAFIDCDGGRMLEIDMYSDSTSYLYSYLLEVTNYSIMLIK